MVGAWALTTAGHIIAGDIRIMDGDIRITDGDTLITEAIGQVIIMVIGMGTEMDIIMEEVVTIQGAIILITVIQQHIVLVEEVLEAVQFLGLVDDQEIFQAQVPKC